MPDPMAKWTPVPDWSSVTIARPDWTARPILGLSMVLAVGDMTAALADLAPGKAGVGLWQIAETADPVIRIARDKALIIATKPIEIAYGWHPTGYSATPAESAYGVIEIAGEPIRMIASEATSADLEAGSPSAATLFAGVPCLLIRTAPDVARLHVEAGYMTYVWRWLEKRV